MWQHLEKKESKSKIMQVVLRSLQTAADLASFHLAEQKVTFTQPLLSHHPRQPGDKSPVQSSACLCASNCVCPA